MLRGEGGNVSTSNRGRNGGLGSSGLYGASIFWILDLAAVQYLQCSSVKFLFGYGGVAVEALIQASVAVHYYLMYVLYCAVPALLQAAFRICRRSQVTGRRGRRQDPRDSAYAAYAACAAARNVANSRILKGEFRSVVLQEQIWPGCKGLRIYLTFCV
jgi:hypothetical protein